MLTPTIASLILVKMGVLCCLKAEVHHLVAFKARLEVVEITKSLVLALLGSLTLGLTGVSGIYSFCETSFYYPLVLYVTFAYLLLWMLIFAFYFFWLLCSPRSCYHLSESLSRREQARDLWEDYDPDAFGGPMIVPEEELKEG